MTAKTRLAKIEKRLTPQEVVLAYLDEIMRRFDSFGDWAEWVADRPSEAPLIRVCRATTDAVRNTMKGRPRDVIAKARDGAVREAIFLGFLAKVQIPLVRLAFPCKRRVEIVLTVGHRTCPSNGVKRSN